MSTLLIKEMEDGVVNPLVTEIEEMLELSCYQNNKHSYKINGGDSDYLHLECKDCGLVLSHQRRLMFPFSRFKLRNF